MDFIIGKLICLVILFVGFAYGYKTFMCENTNCKERHYFYCSKNRKYQVLAPCILPKLFYI